MKRYALLATAAAVPALCGLGLYLLALPRTDLPHHDLVVICFAFGVGVFCTIISIRPERLT